MKASVSIFKAKQINVMKCTNLNGRSSVIVRSCPGEHDGIFGRLESFGSSRSIGHVEWILRN